MAYMVVFPTRAVERVRPFRLKVICGGLDLIVVISTTGLIWNMRQNCSRKKQRNTSA